MQKPSPSIPDRFWRKVQVSDPAGCWSWTAAAAHGYGRFWWEGGMRQAHRLAYQFLIGPIPDGLEVDHLCRNPGCVNPSHMEPVPQAVNTLRSFNPPARNARKTHCVNGHEFTAENTGRRSTEGGKRRCRTCRREEQRRRRASA